MENTNTIVKQTYDYTKTDLGKMGTWKIKFGKHKGLTFSELNTNEPEYCAWVLTKFDSDDALVQYIRRSEPGAEVKIQHASLTVLSRIQEGV